MVDRVQWVRFSLIAVVASFFILVLVGYWSVFVPFLIALVIAYLIDPVVVFLEKCRFCFSRGPATAIVFSLSLIIIMFFVVMIYPLLKSGVSALVGTVTKNSADIERFFKGAFRWVEDLNLPFNIDRSRILADLSRTVQRFITDFFTDISVVTLSILESLPLLLIIPLMVFYFLKDKEKFFAVLKKYTADSREAGIRALFDRINRQLGGYFRGQVLLSFLVFVITTLAMLILRIPYALLIGLAGGVLNIVPYFGPIVSALPAIILVIINRGPDFSAIIPYDPFLTAPLPGVVDNSPGLLGVVLFFVIMNIIVSIFLSPKIFSRATNIHPLLVLFALFLGAQVFGMIGMLVAIPLAIVVKTILTLVFDEYIKEI